VHRAAHTVDLRGTVADMSKAFGVRLLTYAHPRGMYRGRVGEVHIPRELEAVVQGVFGLDSRPQARPHFRKAPETGGAWHHHAAGTSFTPDKLAKLYDFPAGVNGNGQCIAIIELGGGYKMNDLATYFKGLGIPLPSISSVSVRGAVNSPTGNPNSADGEVLLDIEVAGAVAPGAKIVVYFAHNTNRGFFRAINRAVHDTVHKPSVISISWGGPESSWTPQSMQAYDQAFQAAAAMGVTVCCAAGDGGSNDGVDGSVAHVDFPASSPYALACGGTRLEASGNSITKEVVWNEGATGGATGGGVSDFFPIPSWQSKAKVPTSLNAGHHAGRGVPDVAGNADPATGYAIRVDGVNSVFGGTSAVAPLWAGLIALINQKLGTPVGYLNPLLYGPISAVSGALRDITTGNNDMTGSVGGYQSGPGWDACTGLGTPNGTVLANALQAGATPGASAPQAKTSKSS